MYTCKTVTAVCSNVLLFKFCLLNKFAEVFFFFLSDMLAKHEDEKMEILHVSVLRQTKSSKGVADEGMQISTARGRGRGREKEWCDHSRNLHRCVNVRAADGRDETPLLSLPVEMKMVKGKENARRDKMERRGVKRQYAKEGFVCIPLEEMESYYRYSQSCQQLQQSELLYIFVCEVWRCV